MVLMDFCGLTLAADHKKCNSMPPCANFDFGPLFGDWSREDLIRIL